MKYEEAAGRSSLRKLNFNLVPDRFSDLQPVESGALIRCFLPEALLSVWKMKLTFADGVFT